MSRFTITALGKGYQVEFVSRIGALLTFRVNDREYQIEVSPREIAANTKRSNATAPSESRSKSVSEIRAPIPGIISEVKVASGDTVKTGDVLIVIEAMKMENPIKSPREGLILNVLVKKGDEVKAGEIILTFEPPM
jgi:biotin carboxyl carrier protein